MSKIDPVFIQAITDNVTEVKKTAKNVPDWKYAAERFDQFFPIHNTLVFFLKFIYSLSL